MATAAEIEQLIETYSDRAYASAYRLAGNQADACDLVQETFVRVIQKADLYDPAFDFGGWLHRMLFRVYLNGRRSRERRREVPLDPPPGEETGRPEQAAPPGESPDKIAENNELRERIARALDTLSADMRACVVLVDMEGCDYERAALTLGWPVGSLSGRLFRARRLLRDSLTEAGREK